MPAWTRPSSRPRLSDRTGEMVDLFCPGQRHRIEHGLLGADIPDVPAPSHQGQIPRVRRRTGHSEKGGRTPWGQDLGQIRRGQGRHVLLYGAESAEQVLMAVHYQESEPVRCLFQERVGYFVIGFTGRRTFRRPLPTGPPIKCQRSHMDSTYRSWGAHRTLLQSSHARTAENMWSRGPLSAAAAASV